MIGRNVQGREVMPIVFDVRAFGDGEAHFAENRDDLVNGLADRVHIAFGLWVGRQRHVDFFGHQATVQVGVGKGGFFRIDGGGDFVFQGVQRLAGRFAGIGIHLPQALHQIGDAAFLAERRHAECFECAQGVGVCGFLQQDVAQLIRSFHRVLAL